MIHIKRIFMNFLSMLNRHEKLCIFLFIFIMYNINFRSVYSGDTFPASLLPISILENQNLYLDKFYDFFVNEQYNIIWFITEKSGHYLSTYPIVLPIIIIPLYIIPFVFLKIFDYPIELSNPGFYIITIDMMQKLSASIITSISCIFIYLSLKKLTDKRIALIGTMTYAFATNTWSVSSQALWQHGISELLLSIMIFLIIKNEENGSIKNYMFLGVLSGLFMVNRPPDIILLLPVFLYAIDSKNWVISKKSMIYIIFVIVASLPFFIYNYYYFENLFGGYGRIMSFSINFDKMANFAGLLISPNRGLFIYSPVLILSIFGYRHINNIGNKKIRNFFYISGISIMSIILLYSTFPIWWGGGSYGPRFLVDISPMLTIFLSLYLYKKMNEKKNMIFVSIFSIFLMVSIFIQIVGAFYYPNGNWNGSPIPVDKSPERLWDWKDTQIKREFIAGPIIYNPISGLKMIFKSKKDIMDHGDMLIYGGWHSLEFWEDIPTRWMNNNATIEKQLSEERAGTIKFNIISLYKHMDIQIYLNDKIIYQRDIHNDSIQKVEIKTKFEKGRNKIRFYSLDGCKRPMDILELNNNDGRCLSFAFQNIEFG